MTTQPALAADMIRLSFGLMFMTMTMGFLAIARATAVHAGEANAD